MNTHLKDRVFKILEFIVSFVIVISFLNINIQVSDDVIVSIWNYIWNPDKQYVLMTIVSYIGILLILIPNMLKINKKYIKPKLFSNIGIAVLWIIILIFLPELWDGQRYDLINYQYTFVLSTLYLISVKSICRKLNDRTNLKMI